MIGKLEQRTPAPERTSLSVEQALEDFGLREAFLSRPAHEQAQWLGWVAGAGSDAVVEDRISYLLDALWLGSRPATVFPTT